MTDNTSPGPKCSLRRSHRQGNVLTLTHDAAARREIEEMVARERDCCAFLGFELGHAGEDVLLVITVPALASENVDALLPTFDRRRREPSADAAADATQSEP